MGTSLHPGKQESVTTMEAHKSA